MFFLLVGLVTEYYTGQSMPDQVYTIASLLLSSPLLKLLSSSLLSPLLSLLPLPLSLLLSPRCPTRSTRCCRRSVLSSKRRWKARPPVCAFTLRVRGEGGSCKRERLSRLRFYHLLLPTLSIASSERGDDEGRRRKACGPRLLFTHLLLPRRDDGRVFISIYTHTAVYVCVDRRLRWCQRSCAIIVHGPLRGAPPT